MSSRGLGDLLEALGSAGPTEAEVARLLPPLDSFAHVREATSQLLRWGAEGKLPFSVVATLIKACDVGFRCLQAESRERQHGATRVERDA